MPVRYSIKDSDWSLFCGLFAASGEVLTPEGLSRLRSDLEHYLELLLVANEVTNLTAIRDPAAAVWKHLYDSLVLVALRPQGRVLDWGTGGGLPGIPLALFRRAVSSADPVCLLDSVKKKAALVQGFCSELGLSGSRVYSERGEALLLRERFDTVVMRAVAPPERAIQWMSRNVGSFLFMTGPEQVLQWRAASPRAASLGFELVDVSDFLLPQGHGTRFVVRFRQK